MRVIIVGLGIQGHKRLAIAGSDVVATVDPVAAGATQARLEDVPLEAFDAALVCTPDHAKLGLLRFLLSHGKHVLVEKPLLGRDAELQELQALAREARVACYTAYNHRFEPHITRLKAVVDAGTLGPVYLARCFYGNGTAVDVKQSSWRDQGAGVLTDLGSHLLDIALFLFGEADRRFERWSVNRFENRACDHVLFGSEGRPLLELEGTLVSWRNTFTLDVYGERGSAHIHGLCKWGPSLLVVRHRVRPSGRPTEEVSRLECPDPTWALEYAHFQHLVRTGGTNLSNDLWIASALNEIAQGIEEEALALG